MCCMGIREFDVNYLQFAANYLQFVLVVRVNYLQFAANYLQFTANYQKIREPQKIRGHSFW